MNLFDLGGQLLRVGRAVTPPGDRNLGAGGVPQAMPRFDHITISKLSCNQLFFFFLQCICSSSCSSDCQDPSDGRSGDKFGSGRFETRPSPGQTCSARPKSHNCGQPDRRLEGPTGELEVKKAFSYEWLDLLSDPEVWASKG